MRPRPSPSSSFLSLLQARSKSAVLVVCALNACTGSEHIVGPPPAGFATVAAGGTFACGVTARGVGYCWGDNSQGQLGTGTTVWSATPVAVAGGLSFMEISTGGGSGGYSPVSSFACGVAMGGTAYCWGNNTTGGLGDGTTVSHATPVAVKGGLTFKTVSAGAGFACGVTTTGAAYCWGDNGAGQLGTGGTYTSSLVPVPVASGQSFTAVSAGVDFACGVTSVGSAYCWGANAFGQLGTGTTTASATPVAVASGLIFNTVSAGNAFACGIAAGSAAYCWGANGGGQLGIGTTTGPQNCFSVSHPFYCSPTPVAVRGGLTFTSVSAGTVSACGVTTGFAGGTVDCWGDNYSGELGTGTTTASTTPVVVAGGLAVTTVSAGNRFACGIASSDAAYCWGANDFGQIGSGTAATITTPVPVTGGHNFTALSAEDGAACGVAQGGAAYCWGFNGYGQLGTGTTANSAAPVAVTGGLTFSTVSVGGGYTCGLTTGGAAYCWGLNQFAALGANTLNGPEQCATNTGPVSCSTKPVGVVGGLSFTNVSAGKFSACGLVPSGAAYCWGADYYGLLGADSGTALEQCVNAEACSSRPVPVGGGLTFATISVGEYSACGVTTGGAAYCWGGNYYGELGTGTTAYSPKPVAVAGGLTFATVSTEYSFACGVTTSGAAYCWGLNAGGALGDGTTTNSSVPVAVAGGLTFKGVSTGGGFACAVTTSNTDYCWGGNTYGQLGTGTVSVGPTPAPAAVVGGHAFSTLSAAGYSSFFAPPVYPFFTCGLTMSGAAYCWGSNGEGELGTGTPGTPALVPTRVSL